MNRFPAERLLGPMLLLVGLVLAGCASPGAAGSPADDNPDRPVADPTGTPPATSAAPAPEPDPTTGALLVTVHAPDGTPLADACLDIQPLDPGLPPLPELARCTDPAGAYHLPGLAPGRYRVIASHPAGTGTTAPTEVTVAGGETARITVTVTG